MTKGGYNDFSKSRKKSLSRKQRRDLFYSGLLRDLSIVGTVAVGVGLAAFTDGASLSLLSFIGVEAATATGSAALSAGSASLKQKGLGGKINNKQIIDDFVLQSVLGTVLGFGLGKLAPSIGSSLGKEFNYLLDPELSASGQFIRDFLQSSDPESSSLAKSIGKDRSERLNNLLDDYDPTDNISKRYARNRFAPRNGFSYKDGIGDDDIYYDYTWGQTSQKHRTWNYTYNFEDLQRDPISRINYDELEPNEDFTQEELENFEFNRADSGKQKYKDILGLRNSLHVKSFESGRFEVREGQVARKTTYKIQFNDEDLTNEFTLKTKTTNKVTFDKVKINIKPGDSINFKYVSLDSLQLLNN